MFFGTYHEIETTQCLREASFRRRRCVMSKSTPQAAPSVPVLSLAGMEFQQSVHTAPQSSERNLETQGFPQASTSPFPMFFIVCLSALNILSQ